MPAIETQNKTFLSISSKDFCIKYKENGEVKTTTAWEGRIENMKLVFRPAFQKGDISIPARYVYQLELEDAILELPENSSYVRDFINGLAALPFLSKVQNVHFRVYPNKKNRCSMYLSEHSGGDWMPKKYEWNSETNTLKGVPRAIDTGEVDDNGKTVYDWTPVNEFWRNEWATTVYPALNEGTVGEPPRAPELVEIWKNASKKAIAGGGDLKARFESMKKKVAGTIYHPDDIALVMNEWKGVEGVSITEGTTTNAAPATTESEPTDDLPF